MNPELQDKLLGLAILLIGLSPALGISGYKIWKGRKS